MGERRLHHIRRRDRVRGVRSISAEARFVLDQDLDDGANLDGKRTTLLVDVPVTDVTDNSAPRLEDGTPCNALIGVRVAHRLRPPDLRQPADEAERRRMDAEDVETVRSLGIAV